MEIHSNLAMLLDIQLNLKKSIGIISVLAILALYLFGIGLMPNLAVLHTASANHTSLFSLRFE